MHGLKKKKKKKKERLAVKRKWYILFGVLQVLRKRERKDEKKNKNKIEKWEKGHVYIIYADWDYMKLVFFQMKRYDTCPLVDDD